MSGDAVVAIFPGFHKPLRHNWELLHNIQPRSALSKSFTESASLPPSAVRNSHDSCPVHSEQTMFSGNVLEKYGDVFSYQRLKLFDSELKRAIKGYLCEIASC